MKSKTNHWTRALLTALLVLLASTGAQAIEESQVTLLNYIRSTGAQAFNTGYTHKANTRIELDCAVTKDNQRDWEALFGGRLGDFRSNAFVFFSRHRHNTSTAKDAPCFNRSGEETDGTDFVYGERIKLVCEGKTAKWYRHSDLNTVVGSITAGGTADDGKTPMYLFDLNTASSEGGTQQDNSKSVMTLYGCKIYEGSTLKCDFVPAEYNNEVGLYDRVNKTFGGSITTTPFKYKYEYASESELADGTELLKNGQCDGTFNNWTATGGNNSQRTWAVKTLNGTTCWASSCDDCTLSQTVVLSEYGFSGADVDAGKVHCQASADIISTWCNEYRGGRVADVKVEMLDASDNVLETKTVLEDLSVFIEWTSFKTDIFTLQSGTRKLRYVARGRDPFSGSGWLDQYGPAYKNLSLMASTADQGGGNDPVVDVQADYERALATIVDGQKYRVYTMYNNQKYYVTANGKLSTAVADAPLFEFKKVAPNTSTDGAGEYGYGFQLKNGSYYFSNADDENGGKLKVGYLNARTDEHRTTWEAQVFFLNAEGKYAIRSTNAKSGTTGWAKVGSAFWTVETGTNGPVAQYDYEMNYVWQLEVEDDVQTNYERALATIVDGQKYRVYTMYNNQKYYVTANGKLSTAVTDAPLFEFKKVTANASEREYQYGFQLKNGSYYFTNPKEQSEEYLTKGQLNTTNGNSRTTWEAQVFFLNTEGKYAIRSTNSKYSNDHTNWGWIGSAFWTVNTGPLAEYSWDMNYVWQLEDAGPGEPEVYTGFATIDGIYCNLDGTTRKAEVTYKDENYNSYSGDVTVPEKVTYLGTDYTVTAIGEEAFFRSSDLTSVTLPATVTTIDAGAFQYCTALTSFTVSKSVTSIGENPFSGCNGLTSLTVESGNPKYDSRDNCNAIIDSEVNTLVSACNVTVIPDDVKTIGTCSFLGLNKITSVEIPNSVESIASYAFYSCTNLASVTFSENLKTIDNDAFQSCTALMEIHSLVETPFTTGSHVFFKNTYKNATLYVPIGTKSAYESTEVWSNFENIVEETNTVTYPVWVGDTQVTDANKDNVLGDGTVTYEPGEGTGTLTFSSGTTTINGMYNAAKIYADGINLTIDAPKGLFIENFVYGIYMSGANSELTVNGDLTFKTSQNPIYSSSHININGNLTAAEGYTGINAKYIAVNGNVNMKLSTYCISASEIVLNGTKHELSASSPCLSGTNITVTGDLTATSNNTPAINAKGDVTLVSGTWTLDGGNIRAIELGSNANLNIPSTYAIIEPENAQIQTASSGYNARKTIADAEGNEATHVVIGDPSALVSYTVNITGGKAFAQEPDPYVPMEAPGTEFKAGSTVYILPNAVSGRYVTGWNTSPDIDITQKELVYYFKMPAENVTLTPVYSSQTPLTYDLSDGKQVRIGDNEDDLLALEGLLMIYWQKGQLLGKDEFDYYDLDGDGTNDITLYMDQDSEELVIQATDGTNLTGIYFTDNNISPFGPIKIKFSPEMLDEDSPEPTNLDKLTELGQEMSVILKRTLRTGGWNTFASPVTFSDFTNVFGEGVKVKQLKDATLTDGVLNLKFEDATTIEGFTPYLVKVAADVDLSQKTITGIVCDEPVIKETAVLKFIPTMGLPQNSHTDDPKSVLFIGAGSKLYYADALPLDIKGFRAFFVLNDPAAVRSVRMDFGDGATSLREIRNEELEMRNADEWYSVDGRKLSGRPTAKGVYINNGKKTIVK